MTISVADRVRESSSVVGTALITLEGPTQGFQSFSTALPSGSTTYYCLTDNINWEVGQGTLTSSSPFWTLSRDIILSSSNSGLIIDFPVGIKDVFITAPAEYVQLSPSGGGGGSSNNAPVWITDITPTSTGIVSAKTYVPGTIPSNVVLSTAVSNTFNVTVHVAVAGGELSYSPTVSINGTQATLTQSSTPRWFTGIVNLTLTGTSATVTATSSENSTSVVNLTLATSGPSVLTLIFGAYPGTQTALKSGDHITCSGTTDPSATSIVVYGTTLTVSGGAFSGTLTVGSQSGSYYPTAVASNSFGTAGATFTSITALNLDQTYPTISGVSITYPVGETAFGTGGVGALNNTITNYSSVTYSSSNFSIASPTTYATSKVITNTASGYITGNNITITAVRTNNNAVTTYNAAALIATVAPTASISISGSPVQLISSPTGITYTINLTTSQPIVSAPTLNATYGTWSGSWSGSGSSWSRGLIISDATPRGTGTFTTLSITGASGLVGSTITSGSTYIVGGSNQRILTYAPYSRVAAIGTSVYNQNNTVASYTGGNTLTLHTDNGVYVNGYYIANSDGTYNANGSYLGISDTAFAGSNGTGTLELTFQENA